MTTMQELPFPLKRKLNLMYLQYHHDTLHLEIEEFGVQWMDLSCILKKFEIFMSNRDFSNGWTHDHYVTIVFVFVPDGTIPISFLNVHGISRGSQEADWGYIY